MNKIPPLLRDLLLVTIGGIFYFLGFVGFGIWPLALISLVPLWIALQNNIHNLPRAAFLGWVYGLVAYAGGYHWLVPMLETFSGYVTLVAILFSSVFFVLMGTQFSVYALLFTWSRRKGWPLHASGIAWLLLIEWAYPLLFPTYLGNSLTSLLPIFQIADIGGPLLLSALVAFANLAILKVYYARKNFSLSMLKFPTLVCAAFLASWWYGSYRISQVDASVAVAPHWRVGMVQVNMGIFDKREQIIEGLQRHVDQSLKLEKREKLDLLVWPESAYAGALPFEFEAAGNLIKGDVRSPLLFGTIRVKNLATDPKFYNSAMLLDRNGKILGSYDKIHLLAFGEYIPGGELFPFLYSLTPYAGRFWPGEKPEVLKIDGWRFAPLICYEDILAGFTRAFVQETRPNVLVNLTNDAWFGKSQEPAIHLALARMRSVEHHLPMIRSTNSGISAFIDPVGRIRAHSGVQTIETIVDDVPKLQPANTVYAAFGHWPAYFSLILCFSLMWQPRSRKS